jgi:hypothetical protein
MPRHVGIGPVDRPLVKAGLGDPGLEIVANRLAGEAAEISEGADMCPIQSGSFRLHTASAYVKLDAPRTATKICTGMTSPVRPSTTSPVRPAKSTNSFSPAIWGWRIVGFSRPAS